MSARTTSGDRGRHRGGFADHAGGERHVEAGPWPRRAGLLDHGCDEFVRRLVHKVGGLVQQGATLAGPVAAQVGNASPAAFATAFASPAWAAAALDAALPATGSIRSKVT